LLAEALRAAEEGLWSLQRVIGPAEDMLIWIPKPGAQRGPSALRPLQLPTCLRRLFGTVVADLVGPLVEPLLCRDQMAKKGGDMGLNVRVAVAHLSRPPRDGLGIANEALWKAVMGRTADAFPSCFAAYGR
ncbi:MAG: hypothetical protein ACKPKO_11725, partial [Candidatus Fonsibacter sp.]